MMLAIAAVGLASLLEQVVSSNLPVLGVAPPLTIVTLLLLSPNVTRLQLIILGGLAGYLSDVWAPTRSGIVLLACLSATAIIVLIKSLVHRPYEPSLYPALPSFLATALLASLAASTIQLWPMHAAVRPSSLLHYTGLLIAMTVGLSLIGWLGLRRVSHEAAA